MPAENLVPVKLQINGVSHELSLDPRITLLDLLREDLAMTGTKKGCDHGQCGACTVLVNGRRINSCLSLAVVHDGDEITTIEGLSQGDELHPVANGISGTRWIPVRLLHAGPNLFGGCHDE